MHHESSEITQISTLETLQSAKIMFVSFYKF